LLQQQSRFERQKGREGMKIGGLICVAVGLALTLLLLSNHDKGYPAGLFPALVGVALLVYVYVMAAQLE
jgi:hypothetical protein